MANDEKKFRINWSWGFIGLLGILGYILEQPIFYIFFILFLFFLEPVVRKNKQ